MNQVVVLKNKSAERLAEDIEAFLAAAAGVDTRIISIISKGSIFYAFINTELDQQSVVKRSLGVESNG